MSDYAPQIVELRPMGIGDILDATFRLYKKYFVPFMVIALVAYLPYALYTVATGVIWPDPEIQVSDNPTPEELLRIMSAGSDAQRLAGRVGDIIFGIFVFPLIQAGMTFAISAAILGETVSAGGALSRAKSRMWAVLGTQILVNIVVFIGFILLFVPGIIFSLWFMIAVPVVVIEGLSGSGAMSRARTDARKPRQGLPARPGGRRTDARGDVWVRLRDRHAATSRSHLPGPRHDPPSRRAALLDGGDRPVVL